MINVLRALFSPAKKQSDRPYEILVVEDEAIVAHDLQQRLTRMGYTVSGVASNGQQAVEQALETCPQLILMDINLGPGMNGIEAALAILQHRDLPVVYISANSDADTARRAARSGPFGYILKPFEDRELETAIQMALVKHEMELSLRESQRWFNATLSSIADGVVATRPDGCISFFNPSAEMITGWDQANVLGKKVSEILPLQNDGTHDQDTDFFSSFLETTSVPAACRTAVLKRHDGLQIPIEFRAAHIHDERGRTQGKVISFSDISTRRRAEENVQRAQQELNIAHTHLQHQHQELQSFYHIVSHEVKTPLTSAREFASLVLEGAAGAVNDTQKEYLGLALESCDQMRTCINDMLDVTRLQTGKMSLELKAGPLGDLALRVLAGSRLEAERKRIHLTGAVKPDLGNVLMDETRMAQVIGNLLNNALKFTPPGGEVSMVVQSAPDHPDQVQIVVTDTGCGIPTQDLGRIFERLYQVSSEDSPRSMGLGLGLHICDELVRLHHGTVRVESVVDKGSTFCVTLPVSAPMRSIQSGLPRSSTHAPEPMERSAQSLPMLASQFPANT
jgi:PAS domain S-box-containing protein